MSNVKIAIMAERYSRFLSSGKNAQYNSVLGKGIDVSYNFLSKIWNKIMPKCIRGPSSQYEEFQIQSNKLSMDSSWMSQKSIQQTINQGSQKVLGVCYSKDNLHKINDFFCSNNGKRLKKQFKICPIQFNGKKYREEYASKIFTSTPAIFIFWKGLFNELIVLGIIDIQTESFTIQTIQDLINNRKAYEMDIKLASEVFQSTASSQNASLHKLNLNPDQIHNQTHY